MIPTTVAGTGGQDQPVLPRREVPQSAGWPGIDILQAEWTKLRTAGGTGWLLMATAALAVIVSAATAAATKCAPGTACPLDITKLSLTGIEVAQALVAVLAVVAIGTEYATGMIRTTFTAMPRRVVVLAAKAAVVTGLVAAASVAAVAGCLLAGRLILPGNGFDTSRGFSVVSLADAGTLRAATGSVLYLALIGLLSLGIATMVRDSAVAVGAVLGLLYIAPIIVAVIGNPVWPGLEEAPKI